MIEILQTQKRTPKARQMFLSAIVHLRFAYTRKNARVVTDLQTSCNKVVVKPISGYVCTAYSQLL
jgi:hypothetical protein